MGRSSRLCPISLALWLSFAICVDGAFPTRATPPPAPGTADADEQFVESLGSDRESNVDSARLARLLFRLASTLDGGRTSARLLESVVSDRDPEAPTSRITLAHSFERFETAVSRFNSKASGLLDDPDSAVRLYRTLTEGHRACWQLSNYIRLVQSHGVSAGEMMTVVASIESCRLFRRLAQQPRVEAKILDALTTPDERSGEVRELREELQAMEDLLEDLRRIDADEAQIDR